MPCHKTAQPCGPFSMLVKFHPDGNLRNWSVFPFRSLMKNLMWAWTRAQVNQRIAQDVLVRAQNAIIRWVNWLNNANWAN